jgi:hypothetical protein
MFDRTTNQHQRGARLMTLLLQDNIERDVPFIDFDFESLSAYL